MTKTRQAYKTLAEPGESELTVERSRFVGFARTVASVDEATEWVETVRKEHYDARHVCFGFRIGHGAQRVDRSNDDGEPARTGGFPLWQLLDGAEVTNAIIAVVRYYGGVKLGTGGLARAYRDTGREAMEAAGVVTVHPEHRWSMSVPYAVIDNLEHKMESIEGLRIVDKTYGADVTLELAAQWQRIDDVREALAAILQVDPESIAPNAIG